MGQPMRVQVPPSAREGPPGLREAFRLGVSQRDLKGSPRSPDPKGVTSNLPDRGCEPPVHVLVVDDNPEILEILSELLEESGYHVTCCSGGLSALLAIGRLHPDIMLLDLKLDDISGFDVYRAVRADAAVADLPILFVSGVYLDQQMICARLGDEGARLLLKPIPGELLISEIEQALRVRRTAA
jgi:CheY-like chemotaxis protein